MKNKKILAFLLTLLMIAPTIVGCSETTPEISSDTTQTTQQPSAETVEEVPETTVADKITETYTGIDYNGYEYRILGNAPGTFFYNKIADQANEIWYESETGDIYNDAVYTRNRQTEELLNITIVPEWSSDFDLTPTITKLVAAGDSSVETALAPMAYLINIAANGNLHNLHDIDSIELEQPWYDQSIVQNYSYKTNKLYAIAGAFNIFDDYGLPVVFYGKEILKRNNLEDPTTLVQEGTWTIDAMMSMAETATTDVDGDGQMTNADAWGFTDNGGALQHLMEGTGHTFTLVDDQGIPYLDCMTPEYLDVVETLYNRILGSAALMQTNNAELVKIFKEERNLFYYELLGCINEFRDMESDFSLLPLPKYDEQQEHYVTPVNSVWCTALGIPVTVSDTERTGTILNVLSAYSVDTVDKTLYELILGSKLIRDEMTSVMLDHVWANKQYCWGNGYSWSSQLSSLYNTQTSSNSFIMASQLQKINKALQKSLDRFLLKFDELP